MEIQGSIFDIGGLVVQNARVAQMAHQKTTSILSTTRDAVDNTARQTVQHAIESRQKLASSNLGQNINVTA